ncbi:hypothetical protein AA800_21210 [Salmonella enterica subsp. enterica serovar Paratyphi B]|uniref:Uncharacterized protein n=1 Tax=Salmonella paratyphi B TaxID=57045 RepID=A0A5T5I814_SALEB|nr:hypothetical protein [Salmonella enterica subsp. enterica]EBM1014414.1 hypothetical protein [Salmonella enterica subsp. enterica serovar Paratyphi B]EBP0027471.1 hypothetical protein [Salmonella enterica]EGZ4470345.1 hypothetical protein [Salmonella enterica subsp. enterica serovar Java]EBM1042439.1 hypothetical protein [Salmonella enterica subsp. enterica serovar Paratyphi B]
MLSKMVSDRVGKRFQNREIPQLPMSIKGQLMKRVKIEFSSGGIVIKHTGFKVLQGDRVLVEDFLSGKISDVFVRHYQVCADHSPVSIQFTKGDVPGLNVKATLS